MSAIRVPKSMRAKRELLKHAPKLVSLLFSSYRSHPLQIYLHNVFGSFREREWEFRCGNLWRVWFWEVDW